MNQSVGKSDGTTATTDISIRWQWLTGFVLTSLLAFYGTLLQAGHPAGDSMRLFQLEQATPVVSAPGLALPGLDGTMHQLSDYQGQVVVINFLSTWCAPCRREMPALEKAWQRLKPAGVVVLAVAMQDDPEMVRRFLQESGVTFPILLDQDGKASQQWSFSGIPATFVLDKRSRIIYRAMGLREWDSDEIIHRLIELAERE
ncbi:MAG: alkyl hydroperoxide reductase [Sedimenticola selenatireducens]|uniref:Alkyl hydroperoxide reductase n=2 Tax=Sedimenticola selenatireducens TaxID=191960 RepID=A0A2N6CX20_9GAMM|nr:MAG: alkyl hydroperoxide reductase [Sedimenticola selenatireducens]